MGICQRCPSFSEPQEVGSRQDLGVVHWGGVTREMVVVVW